MITPILAGADSTKVYNISFPSTVTDLSNIDMQIMNSEVIHRVQSKHSMLRPFCEIGEQRGTLAWYTRTAHVDPSKRSDAVPDSPSRKVTFDKRGISCEIFDDGAYLVDAVVQNSSINVTQAIIETIEKGFERLFDKQVMACFVKPVRQQTSPDWVEGATETNVVSLDVSKYCGGAVDATGALAVPTTETFRQIRKNMKKLNVDLINMSLCGLLTPGMEAHLEGLEEFKNRDIIYSLRQENSSQGFVWKKIKWVPILDDVNLGAFYADKWMKAKGAKSSLVNLSDATSAGYYDLTDQNHEVVPLWVPGNIKVRYQAGLHKATILFRPDKMNTPQYIRSLALGASRIEDEKGFNLIVPV